MTRHDLAHPGPCETCGCHTQRRYRVWDVIGNRLRWVCARCERANAELTDWEVA